jgi:hypothetical protein
MMRLYCIPLLCVLLFTLGWLFRRPLATPAANLLVRILAGLFAVAGAIAWTLLLFALAQFGNAMAGAGDGAGTARGSDPLGILLAGIIWLLPMTGFVFMLLGSLGVLKGALRRLGYWYALIFLVVIGGAMMVVSPHYYAAVKWIGLACLLIAVLWGYAFNWKTASTPS